MDKETVWIVASEWMGTLDHPRRLPPPTLPGLSDERRRLTSYEEYQAYKTVDATTRRRDFIQTVLDIAGVPVIAFMTQEQLQSRDTITVFLKYITHEKLQFLSHLFDTTSINILNKNNGTVLPGPVQLEIRDAWLGDEEVGSVFPPLHSCSADSSR